MTEFTPFESLVGGAIIGFSAILLLLFKGRVAGVSGILNDLFSKDKNEVVWRWLFISGIAIGPLLLIANGYPLSETFDLSWANLIVGAFLVGVGTNLGSGCTSGHGICGIGRLSKRSISATLTFMLVAIATVTVTNFFSVNL
jgi:uncharacterized membrane protein YedE/YeeE